MRVLYDKSLPPIIQFLGICPFYLTMAILCLDYLYSFADTRIFTDGFSVKLYKRNSNRFSFRIGKVVHSIPSNALLF